MEDKKRYAKFGTKSVFVKLTKFKNVLPPRDNFFNIDCEEASLVYGHSTVVWLPHMYSVRIQVDVDSLPEMFLKSLKVTSTSGKTSFLFW